MPLPEPIFDSRSYRELLNEAIARIPTHNPEWTNFNDSDPGITLLQLFAFLSEAVIYRANLIPERNRASFLRLLDLPMRPAEAARGIVVFEAPRSELETKTLKKNLEVFAGAVPFRSENALDLLPIEAKLYYKSPLPADRKSEIEAVYKKLYASYDPSGVLGKDRSDPSGEPLSFYETKHYTLPDSGSLLPALDLSKETEDGALWIALLARSDKNLETTREAIANKTLSLGIVPALSETGRVIYPRGRSEVTAQASLVFEIPKVRKDGGAVYRLLTPRSDVDLLNDPGIVELRLPDKEDLNTWTDLDPLEPGVGNYPPWLEDSPELDHLITWIRIRSPEIDLNAETASRQLQLKLSWVGINAAKVVQRAFVPAEMLPKGTGEPDQTARLIHTPVILDHVRLSVNGETWTRVDDLMAAEPEVKVQSPRFSVEASKTKHRSSLSKPGTAYTVDRESGEIRFGDGLHGKRPPSGAVIQAAYDYGGGKEGGVGIGSINQGTALPQGVKVTNPVPTWGGNERETVSAAEKRIPAMLRHRDRLVSAADFDEIVRNTPGVDIGRVDILPLLHPAQVAQRSEGVVTLMVIPKEDPRQPEAPSPDRSFLQAICEHLSPRRILTTELHIKGPQYIKIWISISVEVIPGIEEGPVRERVRAEIIGFLSPLSGGFNEKGWPLNKAVEAAEISAVATRADGVAKINHLFIGDISGIREQPIPIEGLQLPRLMAVAVVIGEDPPSIAEIQGDQPGVGPEDRSTSIVPVPVVPDIC